MKATKYWVNYVTRDYGMAFRPFRGREGVVVLVNIAYLEDMAGEDEYGEGETE